MGGRGGSCVSLGPGSCRADVSAPMQLLRALRVHVAPVAVPGDCCHLHTDKVRLALCLLGSSHTALLDQADPGPGPRPSPAPTHCGYFLARPLQTSAL